MTNQVKIKVFPQFVETTGRIYMGRRLHVCQAAMLDFESLADVVILSAPTGTGKSFSFPLPVIASKERDGFSHRRCIIVSPTNALIEDMKNQYTDQFRQLRTEILNRKKLDELNAHGLKRWDEILNIARDHDIIITNPDLMNWAIFGGYHFTKGQLHIGRFWEKFDYIVFDEYHLYDEEQIANILSWMIINRSLLKAHSMKYVFASATPEPALKKLLEQYEFAYQEICENITADPSPTARQIHGEITVVFLKVDQAGGESDADAAVENYLWSNERQIKKYTYRGDKVLVMFDRMVSLRRIRRRVKDHFQEFNVAEESGYFTKTNYKEDTATAHLVLATNKVEVGVNLDVKVCIMPPGRFFANFVQRFGRVARGNVNGIVVVFVEKIEKLKSVFADCAEFDYYDFIERCRDVEILNDRNFYTEVVPRYLGAYFYVIQERALKDYAARQVFRENLHLEEFEGETKLMFHTLRGISNKIFNDLKKADKNKGYSWERKCFCEWWQTYLETFRYFRGNSVSVKFIDLDFDQGKQIQEYSLEWVLANRFIIGERTIDGEKCLEVSGYRDEKNELQFVVETFPVGKLTEEHRYLSQRERWDLKNAFLNRVSLCQKDWMHRSQDAFSSMVLSILDDLEKLRLIFSAKRCLISEIKEHTNFL